MQLTKDADVIIVGGGPAGATAAYLLRKQGLDILVIEKDIYPREKLCGGMITRKTTQLIERVFGETVEQLDQQGIVEFSTHDYEIRTTRKSLQAGKTTYPSVFVDRKAYDQHLIHKAKEIGVKVIEGERVLRVEAANCQVATEKGMKYSARFLLGADGVNSIVRNSIPENHRREKAWRKNLATTMEVFLPPDKMSQKINHPILYFGLVDGGYGWVFPNSDKLVIGVGGLPRRRNNFPAALKRLATLAGYTGTQLPKAAGHHIPYGNFLRSPGAGTTLLLGDAAGLVDPFLGEGIYYAQRSGELAAESIMEAIQSGNEKATTDIYARKIGEKMLKELQAIKTYRGLLFRFLEFFGYDSLQFVIKIIGEERSSRLIHGLVSYRLFDQ